ncbi:hypothetical protein DSM112329_02153 [Paraconexibacter sp. AEG42_29]|uniref:DUF3352 domain-containing protein n=1 Tax=Paraconexibacter sp. AEG42_29 TaxID=2997339 RepID=A0AAU7AUH9_9ACTN
MPTRTTTRRPSSRRARRLAAGALLAVALPIAGCGGGDSSSGGGKGDADPSAIVPATSAFYGEVTVKPTGSLKASVETLAKKIAKTDDPGAKIVELLDSVLKEDDVNYKDDVAPWLGDRVGVAITGLANPSSPDFAIVIGATDPDKGVKALKNGDNSLEDRKYKDVTYSFDKDDNAAALATDGTVVIATERAIKGVIDVKKGAASLAKSAKLKQARSSVSAGGLGFFYVDPVAVIDLASAASAMLGSQAGALKSLLGGGKSTALGAALLTTPNAIRLETAVNGAQTAGAANDAAETVAALPDGSVLAAGFGNIGDAASSGITALGAVGGIYTSLLSQFKTITGLDLQEDVLSWMGKGGLFLRASGLTDIGGALVVDTSSPQKSARFIRSLEQLADGFGSTFGLTTRPFSGGGAKGVQLAIPGFPFPVIVATGSGKFVVAVGEGSVAEALKPTAALGDSAQFKATATQLGAPPALYVDVKTIVEFLGLAVGSDPTFAVAKPYLDAFSALAAGSKKSGSSSKASVVVGVK